MNLKLLSFLLILVHNCFTFDLQCANDKAIENQCSLYCYQAVKPLLQFVTGAQEKELEFFKLTETIRKLNEDKAALAIQLENKNKELELHRESLISCKLNMENVKATQCTDATQKFDLRNGNTYSVKIQENNSNMSSCLDKKAGIHEMTVSYVQTFPVYCDSELIGSGWTVIQRRKDASESFNRGWTDYRRGFGNLENNFFIGLEKLYLLTNQKPHELYIYLQSSDNEVRHVQYSLFKIADESENYKLLSVGNPSGNAEDSMAVHVGMMFSTYDRDNDKSSDNCAFEWNSGWWFSACYHGNLNGIYKDNVTNLENGIRWNSWDSKKEFTFVQMMIRPIVN
ncbi:fibrinogen-like protein 1 isoform X1 [Drosophila sulfurigaster albostrigata]|uniref:fibrinogen-like protein 1 isoform X1 n=1 Tax=Drosophila sulfurigaster albostrigata TaxID=89887 RepID=UPI002D21B292|nr:fibrinogen-like protein 1 isoform X1 [Drosophila sulfurigaster albostrigata]